MSKYIITNESIQHSFRRLYRIKALRDIENGGEIIAHKDDLGGYIESESNLAQDGEAWVCDNAEVYGNAWVYDNAKVYGNAEVYGDAWVCDNARVYDNAKVYGNAFVSEGAIVFDNAKIYGGAWVYDGRPAHK